jgi:TPR repeat protein
MDSVFFSAIPQSWWSTFEPKETARDTSNINSHLDDVALIGLKGDNRLGTLQALAERNNAFPQYELGRKYLEGDGVEKDYKLAIHYLTGAFNNHDDSQRSKAAFLLGEAYRTGPFWIQDIGKAKEFYGTASKDGNKDASFTLAKIYALKNNHDQVIHFLKTAHAQGHKDAVLAAGFWHHYGKVSPSRSDMLTLTSMTEENRQMAMRCYEFAAGTRAAAPFSFTDSTLQMESSPKLWQVYEKSKTENPEGNAEASFQLARLYKYPLNLKRLDGDGNYSCAYLQRATAQGHTIAPFEMGKTIEEHPFGYAEDKKKEADVWYQIAAGRGLQKAKKILNAPSTAGDIAKDLFDTFFDDKPLL